MLATIKSIFCFSTLASVCLAAAQPVDVTLDFGRRRLQIEGPEGASVCQFHGSDPVKNTVGAARSYGTLGGFPDDSSATEFGKFCDVAFSTKGPRGMGLSQIWSTPCGLQTPPGAIGKTYAEDAWAKLDFSMYLPRPLPMDRYPVHGAEPVRGHTIAMLNAALSRARRENQRVLFWTDLHTDYPTWMWKDANRKNPIPEEYWDQAALHIVYYVKWLVARYGVPVHTVSFQNEPDMPSRHQFTPEMLVRATKTLRAKLDEAGLYGVRVMPYTSMVLGGSTYVPWMKRSLDTLERTEKLLHGPLAAYQPYVDSLGGHLSHGERPFETTLPNTRFWRASGDFDNHWKPAESVSFDMGPADQIDETIRQNTYLYGKGVSLAGIWQVALRMGHTVDNFVLPREFDIDSTYRRAAIDGAATVYPYVRPGMFLVEGSLGNGPRDPYSVDGFGGSGRREVAVITNSRERRTFRIRFRNAANLKAVEIFQSSAARGKDSLGTRAVTNGEIVVGVPPDSVTALVATGASSRPEIAFVVKDAANLTASEQKLAGSLRRRYDVSVVSQELKRGEQEGNSAKRHPVDPMGVAAYLISDTVDRMETLYAYRTVMAPVIAESRAARKALGLGSAKRVAGGAALTGRDPLDPPAGMLEGGLPKACGDRGAWDPKSGFGRLVALLDWAIPKEAN